MKQTIEQISIYEIQSHFEAEFKPFMKKFKVYDLTLNKIKRVYDSKVTRPGVYVFWKKNRIIKIGKSNVNSHKRALEHIQDNTAGRMGKLGNDPTAHLLLFNIHDDNDLHWVCALETFFERKYRVLSVLDIPAGRLC